MKQIYSCFIMLFLVTITGGCNSESGKKVSLPKNSSLFEKLIGVWQNKDDKSFERWSRKEDGSFRYVAFTVKGTDTSWNEQADVYPQGNDWVFENTVKDQNEGKSVKFTSILLDENRVQFCNPAHDFPTDINYSIADKNTVNAFIVGPNGKGGKDTIPFNYTRVQ